MFFTKAFDKVNHSLLVHKLNHYGIRGRIKDWIADFLSGRRQAAVVNRDRSKYIDVKSGVPQGIVLGLCVFLVYINDLPEGFQARSHVRTTRSACNVTLISLPCGRNGGTWNFAEKSALFFPWCVAGQRMKATTYCINILRIL